MTHFSISLSHCSMSAIARPARAAPAEKGRTGATPPFLPLYRHTWRGVYQPVYHRLPPLLGSLPSNLSLRTFL